MICLQELWNVRRLAGATSTYTHDNHNGVVTTIKDRKGGRKRTALGRKRAATTRSKTNSTIDVSDTFVEDTTCHYHDEHHHNQPQDELSDVPMDLHLCKLRKKEIGHMDHAASYAYLSNHVRVNQERQQRDLPLLTRCAILDEMARGKAVEMAHAGQILTPYRSETLVENVQKTSSLQLLHQLTMHGIDNPARQCILDERFVKFGMGTCRGKDGMIYVSQLFQGQAKPRQQNQRQPEMAKRRGSTATTSTEDFHSRVFVVPTDVVNKNPKTRVIPTIDIQVDPMLLRSKQQRHAASRRMLLQRTQSDTSFDHKQRGLTRGRAGMSATRITTKLQPPPKEQDVPEEEMAPFQRRGTN